MKVPVWLTAASCLLTATVVFAQTKLSLEGARRIIEGSTLTFRAIVAKNVDAMTRPPGRWGLKFEGADSFWLIPSAERAATEPRMKRARLE